MFWQKIFDQISIDQMLIGQTFVLQVSFDKVSVGQMIDDEISVV